MKKPKLTSVLALLLCVALAVFAISPAIIYMLYAETEIIAITLLIFASVISVFMLAFGTKIGEDQKKPNLSFTIVTYDEAQVPRLREGMMLCIQHFANMTQEDVEKAKEQLRKVQ